MESGRSSLLVSYKDLWKESGFDENEKILVNHITFNTESDKYVMLVRNFYEEGGMWLTSMMIGDLNGGFKTVLEKTLVSHYYWVSREVILVFCTVPGEKMALYFINVETGEHKIVDSPYFDGTARGDIHCSLSPDGKYIIGDAYITRR